jgi:hypothetical protein
MNALCGVTKRLRGIIMARTVSTATVINEGHSARCERCTQYFQMTKQKGQTRKVYKTLASSRRRWARDFTTSEMKLT